ncbi:MAG TPA: hypothetical protein DCZ01_07940 [Elusimicrobia bacterium]|nr:MAG: hypothetical protein A2X37_06095 [Elusimicrobia bacterium GWA2_66_18]OGR68561.1 MAG: hypothetical protein A2X40_12450 [Elusimicrobia bacterium GWC2_65_9]HAZ08435.1 hypothetical protein [Elusimicrobiota bacterium]
MDHKAAERKSFLLRIVAGVIGTACCALIAACAGPSKESKKSVAELTAAGAHAAAAERVRAARDEYGASNVVLYELDLAMALHVAGRYRESSEHFARAEEEMEGFYTRKMSRAAGALLANENIEEYRGDPSDRALAHIFHALNYAQLGELDEALVEVRRVEAFLDERARGMGDSPVAYTDDAFARYLAAMLYAEAGKLDDARISHETAKQAYRDYEGHYKVSAPSASFQGDLGPDGELVFLHYNGPAPYKRSVSTPGGGDAAKSSPGREESSAAAVPENNSTLVRVMAVAAGAGKAGLKAAGGVAAAVLNIAYPEYAQKQFRIKQSQVELDRGTWKTELAEDIFEIVNRDLDDRLLALKSRSAMRGAVKLLGTVTGLDATGSESADLRCWQTLPSQIRFARIRLPAGEHRVTLRYLDGSGVPVSNRQATVTLRGGRRTWIVDRTVD